MKQKTLIILIFLLLIPLGDLFHSGLPITHDGQDHVVRIANFYHNLQDGIILPRWGANLNWGYGHPVLMFLYPLPSYSASLFHFFGFSFVDSVKIIFGLSFVLSGVTMYLWLRGFLSSQAAMIGSLLYTFAPYRFVDLYVRGAIGEHVAFIFPPLVLYFLFRLSQKQSYSSFFGGCLSMAGLILAHNAISLMFLPVIFFYAGYLIYQRKKRLLLIFQFSFLILFGFLLSSFFWVPGFFEGRYTLRDIVVQNEALKRFVPIETFVYGPWDYGGTGSFTVQIGVMHWIAIVISLPVLIVMFRHKHVLRWLALVFLIGFVASLFLMTAFTRPMWEMITLLQTFQFPWRFLSVSVFLAAVISAFVVDALMNYKVFKSSGRKLLFMIALVVLVLFVNKDYWHAKAYLHKSETFYTGIYEGTTDTGESAPIWSVRFMLEKPAAPLEIVEGTGIILEEERTTTEHFYTVTVPERARMRENTLYFPGWKVFVDGQEVPLQFQDPNHRGLMTFWVEPGEHDIRVSFGETKLRLLANSLSIGSLIVLLGIGSVRRKIWQS